MSTPEFGMTVRDFAVAGFTILSFSTSSVSDNKVSLGGDCVPGTILSDGVVLLKPATEAPGGGVEPEDT
jgi:hypothetical protein